MSSAMEIASAHMSDCETMFRGSGFVSDDVWYPSNCLLHRYTTDEVTECFRQVKSLNLSADSVSCLTHSQVRMTVTSSTGLRMVFFNALCNKLLSPANTTCCLPRDPHALTFTLVLWLLVCGCLVVLASCVILRRMLLRETKEALTCTARLSPIVLWLCPLMFILNYLYLADRMLHLGVMAIVGHVSWFVPLMVIAVVSTLPAWSTTLGDFKVMSRSQTDETKGWMQIVILVYHYTGGIEVPALYHFVRVLVAGYLFLSGYGHFMYFWTTGDFGIRRFMQVLLRLNLLTVLVTMVMGSPYEQYYFVPLVTFWFVIVYVFMATWPRLTHQTVMESPNFLKTILYVSVKFAVLCLAIEILVSLQERFEVIFSLPPLRWVYSDASHTLHQWWYRLQIDRHAVCWGMVGAFVVCMFRECERLKKLKLSPLLLAVLSVIVLMVYTFMMHLCEDKDAVHTRLAFLPVVAFLVLRNISQRMRSVYNTVFIGVGRMALELCVCQFHIWLAYDMRGLLVYLWISYSLNFIISTVIFFTVSYCLHRLTQNLVLAIMGF